MKSIKLNYTITATVEEVYIALTNPFTIELWTGYPAHVTKIPGDEFYMFGGEISGKNIEYIDNELIKQQWYFGDQQEESIVTIKLTAKKNKTYIELEHTNIPDEEFAEMRTGWLEYFWKPLNKYFR